MKHRKATNARGDLDRMAIRAEEYASYLTKRNRPPQVTLERIANIAEKIINYKHTRLRDGNITLDTRPSHQEKNKRQKTKCLARVWKAYESVQKTEVMHEDRSGQDESWNGAKENRDTKKWIPEPVYYYGDVLEEVLSDELHGDKRHGVNKPKPTED